MRLRYAGIANLLDRCTEYEFIDLTVLESFKGLMHRRGKREDDDSICELVEMF
jgi:hypothetical protein